MECTDLLPPSSVRGMTSLHREKFKKIVQIPKLDVTEVNLKSILPHIKRMLLKIQHHKSIELGSDGTKKLLLHPMAITCFGDLPEEVRNLGLNGSHLKWEEFELRYENWSTEDILKAVLPADQESCTSYSRIGHIIHVNLKTHLLPYKQLIGEVFRDKISGIRCVINKIQMIDNTFRNFSLELLSGEEDYQVEVKENGTNFKFDFSQVYWNPRLATEHERIIKMHEKGDVLYDVFAGVGPFSIPVAKRKAFVLANDLNPSSYKWLQYNMKKNKVTNFMETVNKDGRDFILEDVKCDLIKRWTSCGSKLFKIHLTMNLPAMAVEFLDTFAGLMWEYTGPIDPLPLVHVYCFAKGDDPATIAKGLVEENLGYKLCTNLQGVHFVRNVAPNKDMFRSLSAKNQIIANNGQKNAFTKGGSQAKTKIVLDNGRTGTCLKKPKVFKMNIKKLKAGLKVQQESSDSKLKDLHKVLVIKIPQEKKQIDLNKRSKNFEANTSTVQINLENMSV